MFKKIAVFLVLVFILVAALSLSKQYFYVVPPQVAASVKMPEQGLDEFGDLNKPQFKPAINLYLSDLKVYESMDMNEISPTDDPQQTAEFLYPIMMNSLNSDKKWSDVSANGDEEITKSLAAHITTLLFRGSGLSNSKYLNYLGNPPVHMPENENRFKFFTEDFAHDLQNSTNDDPRDVFDRSFEVSQNFRNGSNNVVAWATTLQGFRVVIDECPASKPPSEIKGGILQFQDRFSEADSQLLNGGVAQGSLVFTSKPFNPTSSYLRAEVIVVIKTVGNDYYPLDFHSYYNPDDGKWHLIYVNRTASMRMATSPSLIY